MTTMSKVRTALIVGRSRGAMSDVLLANQLGRFDAVIVVGKMSEAYPGHIDYLVSFHTGLMDKWVAARTARGLPPPARYWGAFFKGIRLGEKTTRCAPIEFVRCVGGSSGFLAVCGALDLLGAERVVLAGVPMDAEASHFAGAATEQEAAGVWDEADKYWPTWLEYEAKLRGRVRSMSGRTRDLLGAPDEEWLNGK